MQSQMEGMKAQVAHPKNDESRENQDELKQRVEEIEKKFVKQLQMQSCTLVIGNLGDSLQEATEWEKQGEGVWN